MPKPRRTPGDGPIQRIEAGVEHLAAEVHRRRVAAELAAMEGAPDPVAEVLGAVEGAVDPDREAKLAEEPPGGGSPPGP
jgi:hypothetical protein